MLKNYILTSWRNFQRNKVFTSINIFGLSFGMASCLLLLMYVQDEFRYDRHFTHYKEIYRVVSSIKNDLSNELKIATSSAPLAGGIKSNIPEVEEVVRVFSPPETDKSLLQYGDLRFYESDGYLVDSTFFKIFDFEFLEGNPSSALKEANALVLSEAMRIKLFGEGNALGEVVEIQMGMEKTAYVVTGVIKKDNERHHTHLNINYLIPMHSFPWGNFVTDVFQSWVGQNLFYTYIQTVPGADPAMISEKINYLLKVHGGEDMQQFGIEKSHVLQPLSAIHLYSDFDFVDIGIAGNITFIYIFISVAALLLLIACINFINLYTANVSKRQTEIGVRRLIGARKSKLISQFFVEALFMVFLSVLASLVWLEIMLPWFNTVTGKTLEIDQFDFQFYGITLLLIFVITVLLSGIYPAFHLSSYQPVENIKKNARSWFGHQTIRRNLVIFQFIISIALLTGIGLINRQMNFIQKKSLGFEPAQKLSLPMHNVETAANYSVLKDKLASLSFVKSVSATSAVPGQTIWDDRILYPEGSGPEHGLLVKFNYVDYQYPELLSIAIIDGRSFMRDEDLANQNKIIINETALHALGLSVDEALNTPLYVNFRGNTEELKIIGIMADYHHHSLHDKIVPIAFKLAESNSFNTVLIASDDEFNKVEIGQIGDIWHAINTDAPFDYEFLDQKIASQYKSDYSVSDIMLFFTFLAIIVSCLGLYGLSMFAIERRVKEIGIRKVMGASVTQIVIMLSKEFGKLIIIAFVISIPVAYWGINQWLLNFSYKIDIDIWVFIYAGVVAFLLSQVTISFESIKAAMSNPVNSLKNE